MNDSRSCAACGWGNPSADGLDAYQTAAHATATYPPGNGFVYSALGLAAEAGEYANQAKKVIRDDAWEITPERRAKLVSELGDALWYVAECATALGMDLSEVASLNLAKLAERKAAGKIRGDGDAR